MVYFGSLPVRKGTILVWTGDTWHGGTTSYQRNFTDNHQMIGNAKMRAAFHCHVDPVKYGRNKNTLGVLHDGNFAKGYYPVDHLVHASRGFTDSPKSGDLNRKLLCKVAKRKIEELQKIKKELVERKILKGNNTYLSFSKADAKEIDTWTAED